VDGDLICNRFDQLYSERKSLDDTLQLVERFVMPYRNEFFRQLSSEHEVNWRRRTIYDGTAVADCLILANAVASNIIPASYQWFSLGFQDEHLNTSKGPREWLDQCEERLWRTLRESDFHAEGKKMITDGTGFGTSMLLQEEVDDLEWKGLDFTATPLMDTYFELDSHNNIARAYWRKTWTSLQAIDKFPDAKEQLGEMCKDDPVDMKRDYILCIYFRDNMKDADITKPLAPDLRPVGYKWVQRESREVLKEGGYYHMPAMRHIWDTTAGSKYGYSPAMVALSDIMTLNEFVGQKSEATAKVLDPAMWTTDRGFIGDVDLYAGGITERWPRTSRTVCSYPSTGTS
jgi:hypothetical protein